MMLELVGCSGTTTFSTVDALSKQRFQTIALPNETAMEDYQNGTGVGNETAANMKCSVST